MEEEHVGFGSSRTDTRNAGLAVEALALRRGTRQILDAVTFCARAGELLALMGPSGSGKTTVLRAVAGLERFDAGRIRIGAASIGAGAPPSGASARQWHRTVGLVFQFHYLFDHLTALDNVTLAPVHALRMARADAERRAHDLLQALGVEQRAQALPRELSGGEAQRVAIARALAVDPSVLLMDEPTASLDPARRAELADLLRGLVRGGRTLVIATHDEAFAQSCATRVLRIEHGRIL